MTRVDKINYYLDIAESVAERVLVLEIIMVVLL